MKSNVDKMMADYFGVTVEVICRMRHCALIRFGDREFVVDAGDLACVRRFSRAA